MVEQRSPKPRVGGSSPSCRAPLLFQIQFSPNIPYPIMASPSKFIREVRTELAKATWPWDNKEKGVKRYKELIDSTAVTVIGILLLSAFIAFWDYILLVVIGWMTK